MWCHAINMTYSHGLFSSLKISVIGARETCQSLTASALLQRTQPHTAGHNSLLDQSQGIQPLFWSPRAPACMWCTSIHTRAHTHKPKIKMNDFLIPACKASLVWFVMLITSLCLFCVENWLRWWGSWHGESIHVGHTVLMCKSVLCHLRCLVILAVTIFMEPKPHAKQAQFQEKQGSISSFLSYSNYSFIASPGFPGAVYHICFWLIFGPLVWFYSLMSVISFDGLCFF